MKRRCSSPRSSTFLGWAADWLGNLLCLHTLTASLSRSGNIQTTRIREKMSSNRPPRDPLEGHPRYEKISDLNSGSFGFVTKAKDKVTGRTVAIKFLQRGDRIQRYVEREILNHKSLRHPHVVQFYEIFLTEQFLAIVMEYADQGDLFLFVQRQVRLREDLARWIFQQLVFGLDYCHKRGVANRDVKLENVLLQSGHRLPLVKLCDFGYSKHEEWDSAARSRVGTPDYMAPEVVRTREGAYDAKMSDIWSCGVVLFVMLVGQYPFSRNEDNRMTEDQRQRSVLSRIMSLNYHLPSDLTPECRDLIKKILKDDPKQRITISEIMQHPWYKVGLPPNALTMNDVYLKAFDEAGLQSDEDIKKIVGESKESSAVSARAANFSDDFIDATLDEELDNIE
ncbi:hypothetical protein BSKO_07076 [Bryopsis sp. KO-2023]|nr:hypothetical protein BSKO_07076 [Bryopsis sp. KO-2023]